MAERILITGGAGFLGSALAARLCDRCEVVILDSLRRNALVYRDLPVKLIRGDVLDEDCVSQAVQGCLKVVHMASVAGVGAVEADPAGTMRTALQGTANVLQACRSQGGLDRVVIFSSSEVYGPRADNVREEDAGLLPATAEPRWSYALGKLAAEHLGFSYRRQYGLPVAAVRPFNVYGPGQVGEGAVHTFVERALAGAPLTLNNGGGQVRAWCFVDDLIAGLLPVLHQEAAVGRVFNLGNPGQAVSIRELAETVVRLSGSKSRLEDAFRPGPDVEVRIPDISRAREILGFTPAVDLEAGLQKTVEWYRRHACRAEAADG